MSTTRTDAALAGEVAALEWYHTLELAPGVVSPGWHDTRQIVPQVPFPESLEGMRCLDVGTFDGFWAFEMERRGAAEVVAIDILDPEEWDWPVGSDRETIAAIGRRKGSGRGFEIAQRALGSSVRRLERSVYELEESDAGSFDLVYLGSLLVHLREPVRALERLRAVCDGTMIVVDGIDLPLSLMLPRQPVAKLDARGRPWWWYPNQAGLVRMVEAAGFEVIDGPTRLFMPPGPGQPLPPLHPRLLATGEGRRQLVIALRGDPHAVLVARPVRSFASSGLPGGTDP
jgi:tRNA (mo5U34)-methyltransferase